jgi:hypothetical protein
LAIVKSTPLSRAIPVEQPFATIHDLMGADAFGPAALSRLHAAASVDESKRLEILQRLEWRDPRSSARFPWQPHATGAVNAWALLMLPGPGSSDDPGEPTYDWSPGWGVPAVHLAEFPAYTPNTVPRAGHSWAQMRRVFSETPIPGVRRQIDRLACWGVANLTALHSPTEESRAPDKYEVRLTRACWAIGTCRPVVVAVSPGAGGRDLDVAAAALRTLGLAPTEAGRTWSWQNAAETRTYRMSALVWRGEDWSTGLIRLNQHPGKWGGFGNPWASRMPSDGSPRQPRGCRPSPSNPWKSMTLERGETSGRVAAGWWGNSHDDCVRTIARLQVSTSATSDHIASGLALLK